MADPAPAADPKQVIPEPLPESLGDGIAEKEAAAFAEKKLSRDDRMQGHLHVASILMVWAFVCAMIAMGGVWLYHLIAPKAWDFLTDAQIDKLQTVFMAAVTSSLVTDRAKKLNR